MLRLNPYITYLPINDGEKSGEAARERGLIIKKIWYGITIVFIIVIAIWGIVGCDGLQKTKGSADVVSIVTWEGELIGDAPNVKVTRALREEFDRTHPNIKVIRRSAPTGEERSTRRGTTLC